MAHRGPPVNGPDDRSPDDRPVCRRDERGGGEDRDPVVPLAERLRRVWRRERKMVSDAAAVGREAVPSPGLTAGWSGRRTATDPGRADGISPRLHGPEPLP